MKYYRVRLWGYGGEASYMKLTEEQYKFWKEISDRDYDHPLAETQDPVDYIVSDDYDDDHEEIVSWVPPEMDFMKDEDGNRYSWYEAANEYCHQWGVEINNANIDVEEVDSDDYMAKHVANIIENKTPYELQEEMPDETEEMIEYGMATDHQGEMIVEPDYVCQMWSAEKGTFYDGLIVTEGEFDISKLTIKTEEFPNGDDTVVDVLYDGESLDNQGGDTNGKGYTVSFWSNGA